MDNLERGLCIAAKSFCSQEIVMGESEDGKATLELSMIFKWYGSDFGSTLQEQLMVYATYLPESEAIKLREIAGQVEDCLVVFRPYNWSLNHHE